MISFILLLWPFTDPFTIHGGWCCHGGCYVLSLPSWLQWEVGQAKKKKDTCVAGYGEIVLLSLRAGWGWPVSNHCIGLVKCVRLLNMLTVQWEASSEPSQAERGAGLSPIHHPHTHLHSLMHTHTHIKITTSTRTHTQISYSVYYGWRQMWCKWKGCWGHGV